MSGQTFVTRIRFPDAGRQTRAEGRTHAQRLGGTSRLVGSRVGFLIDAVADVATVVPGTESRDGTTTSMDMRSGEARFRVTIEEPPSGTVLVRTSFADSNVAHCGRETEIQKTLAARLMAAGLELTAEEEPGVAVAPAPAHRSEGAS